MHLRERELGIVTALSNAEGRKADLMGPFLIVEDKAVGMTLLSTIDANRSPGDVYAMGGEPVGGQRGTWLRVQWARLVQGSAGKPKARWVMAAIKHMFQSNGRTA